MVDDWHLMHAGGEWLLHGSFTNASLVAGSALGALRHTRGSCCREYHPGKLPRPRPPGGFQPKVSLDAGITDLIKGYSMIRNTRYGNI